MRQVAVATVKMKMNQRKKKEGQEENTVPPPYHHRTRRRLEEKAGDDRFLKTEEDKVLGVRWDKEEDCFWFKVGLNFSPKIRGVKTGPPLTLFQLPLGVPNVLTKRMVLGQVNSVYDPLGLASPFLVKMKVLLRRLWSEGKHLDWDDALSDSMREGWLSLLCELYDMEEIISPGQ